MRYIVLISGLLIGSVHARAQDPAADVAPPAIADVPAVAPERTATEPPQADDPVDRLESRLDRIERRLDQQDAGNETVEPQVMPDPAPADAADAAVDWRYRYQDGVWWYWLPSNRWVYWSNGRWVDHFPDTTRTTVLYRSVPSYPYFPSYSYRYPRSFSSYSLYDYDYPGLYSSYGYYPTYRHSYYGGGYGGYGGWGSAIGLGLSIGHSLSHHHHDHFHSGHFHSGHHHHGHFGHHHGHHHH